MALRRSPVHRALWRPVLLFGADRILILTSGMMCAALVFSAGTIPAIIVGVLLWFASIYILRLLAKADPLMRPVYLRHIKFARYYDSRGKPEPVVVSASAPRGAMGTARWKRAIPFLHRTE